MNSWSGFRIALAAMLFMMIAAPVQGQQSELSAMSDADFIDFLRALRAPASRANATGIPTLPSQEKCGFAVAAEAARRIVTASPVLAAEIRSLLNPSISQTNILSPSGRFRIFFDTSGTAEAAMLADDNQRIPGSAYDFAHSVAAIFDSVYHAEVEELGFDPPPFEETLTQYNVIIIEYNGIFYGSVTSGLPRTSGTVKPTYASYIEIDNDFLEYKTKGLNGLRVTAAHEFHHMIQLGTYGMWGGDRWMHEMTSTYYEEVLYPSINDYFQYIRTFTANTERPFWVWGSMRGGYELALWPQFLEKKWDHDLFRDVWTRMRKVEPIIAMDEAIRARGGDMSAALCLWAQTNFFTGYRADRLPTMVYADAAALPTVRVVGQQLVGTRATIHSSLAATGAMYIRVFNGLDTVSFVVANTDVSEAVKRSNHVIAFELDVRSAGWDENFTNLDNGWAYRFHADVQNALCISLVEGGNTPIVDRDLPFPNPFDPAEFSRICFPLPRNVSVNRADLYIYSASMDLISSRDSQTIELDNIAGAFVVFDGKNASGTPIPSGVYFYHLRFGNETRTGKFAVVKK
ncbi:MAG: MXAN_6640 family putative metalloprotease [Bacteroidota bacterium]|jgi:hypothetical protein